MGALEGTVITVAGQVPYDAELAARATAGVLGLQISQAVTGTSGSATG
jgi:hypothetical protein